MSGRQEKAKRRAGQAISIQARREERAFEHQATEIQAQRILDEIYAEAIGDLNASKRAVRVRKVLAAATLAVFVGAMVLLFVLAVLQ